MNSTYFRIMKAMIWRDMYVLHRSLKDMVINALCWMVFLLITNGYVMPLLGLPSSYGLFMVAGSIVGQIIIQSMNYAALMIADLTGNKEITQFLTIPIPSWLVFIRMGITSAIRSALVGLIMLPVSKLLLWNQFDLTAVAWPEFFLLFIVSNIFFGMGSIWIAARTPTFSAYENIWMRLIVPLWFLSTNFSWFTLYKAIPAVAYIDLINPFIYITEGFHACMLNPDEFMNYWICIGITCVATIVITWRGITLMRRRLDFV